MSAIDDLIKAAQAAGAEISSGAAAPTTATAVATTTAQTALPAANINPGAGAAVSLEDLAGGSLQVDHWMKLSEFGISFGDNDHLVKKLKVSVCPEELFNHRAVRFTIGKKTTYFRSGDGVRELRSGKPWLDVVADCMAKDPKCSGDYLSADIPFVALEDVKDADGKIIVEAGQTIGHTIPMTGLKYFRPFAKKVLLRYAPSARIEGVILFRKMENEGNKWGVLEYGEPTDWAPEAKAEAA